MTLPAAIRGFPAAASRPAGAAKQGIAGRPSGEAPTTSSGPRKGWGSLAVAETNKAMEELRTMGFSEVAVRRALDLHDGDVNQALDFLLTQEARLDEKADSNVVTAVANPNLAFDKHASSSSLSDISTASESFSPPMHQVVPANDALLDHAASTDEESVASMNSKADWETQLGSDATFGVAMDAALRKVAEPVITSTQETSPLDCARPRKRLLRAFWEWPEGLLSNQLGVKNGGFVSVWIDTRTELGWVYAEEPDDPSRAGWLPFQVLEEPPVRCQWTLCSVPHPSTCERQLHIVEGTVYLVHRESFTSGWVYAEVVSVCGARADTSDESRPMDGGWVPDYCFEELAYS